MGHKIITEQDFWICPGGLMPAPMQTGQQIAHKKINVKYITRKDTATASYVDFGCRKLMLIMAILAAVIAVATVAAGAAVAGCENRFSNIKPTHHYRRQQHEMSAFRANY